MCDYLKGIKTRKTVKCLSDWRRVAFFLETTGVDLGDVRLQRVKSI